MSHPKTFHASVKPCHCFETNHGQCYACACASSAERHGANAIALALEASGVPCVVEQTGGFTMVVHVYSETRDRWLAVTAEGVAYDDASDAAFECLSPDWMLVDDDSQLTSERLTAIVDVVKANLGRIR